MKVFAKCPEGDHKSFTAGQLYELISQMDIDEIPYGGGFHIKDDFGDKRFCLWRCCAHLRGKNWERVQLNPLSLEELL